MTKFALKEFPLLTQLYKEKNLNKRKMILKESSPGVFKALIEILFNLIDFN